MKRSTLIVFALFSFCVISCKKDYTCVCKDEAGYEWAEYTIHTSKKKSGKECSDYDEVWASRNAKCELK